MKKKKSQIFTDSILSILPLLYLLRKITGQVQYQGAIQMFLPKQKYQIRTAYQSGPSSNDVSEMSKFRTVKDM